MAEMTNASEIIEQLNAMRQVRQYHPDPVPAEVVNQLLEVARWSGSARNTQPWHFIVVDDRDTLYEISRMRDRINWVADAPMGIALVMDGSNPTGEMYDEGRVSERLMIAAHILGYGSGTAWFGGTASLGDNEARAKEMMGIPDEKISRSIVLFGRTVSVRDHRPGRNIPGRRPLPELVSYNKFGNPWG